MAGWAEPPRPLALTLRSKPSRPSGGDEEEGVALTTEAVHVVFLTREGMRRRTTQRIHVHVCLMYLVYVERSSGEQEQEPVRENGMR